MIFWFLKVSFHERECLVHINHFIFKLPESAKGTLFFQWIDTRANLMNYVDHRERSLLEVGLHPHSQQNNLNF